MYQLLVRRQAQLDVEEAALWYERKRVGLGFRLIGEIDAVLRRIESAPLQFPKNAPDVRRGLLRKFPYSIYFLIGDQAIEVIAVLHQHRHPETWRTRL